MLLENHNSQNWGGANRDVVGTLGESEFPLPLARRLRRRRLPFSVHVVVQMNELTMPG